MTEEVDTQYIHPPHIKSMDRRLLKSCDCSEIESQSTDTGGTRSRHTHVADRQKEKQPPPGPSRGAESDVWEFLWCFCLSSPTEPRLSITLTAGFSALAVDSQHVGPGM